MFDVLAGFYGTVVVEVGREVAVTANLCSRIGEQQEAEKGFKALFCLLYTSVIGTARKSVEVKIKRKSFEMSNVSVFC